MKRRTHFDMSLFAVATTMPRLVVSSPLHQHEAERLKPLTETLPTIEEISMGHGTWFMSSRGLMQVGVQDGC